MGGVMPECAIKRGAGGMVALPEGAAGVRAPASTNMAPSVSVIICTRNRAESLQATLDAVLKCERPAEWDVEIVVADNGSTDDTRGVVNRAAAAGQVKYCLEERVGQCWARNAGLRDASANVILFTDDDVRPSRGWLIDMAGPILAGTADATQGAIVPASYLRREWLRGIYCAMLALVPAGRCGEPTVLVGANMAFGRHVLERVPGFCVDLGPGASGLGDDTLWGMQLRAAGYRLAYAGGEGVEHHFDESRLNTRYFLRWAKMSGESSALMSKRWLGDSPRRPRLRWCLLACKYLLRRATDWRSRPVPPEWCLHYRLRLAYLAKCAELGRGSGA
jgi:glycosyltransferase involved in cell wall biosynthesis